MADPADPAASRLGRKRGRCTAALMFLLLAAGAPAARPAPPAKPHRILSLNMCNDLMLLMLVPKSRIASITYLAHDAVSVLMPGADAGVPVNHGTAEEVVRAQPDLILASPWSTPVVRRFARAVHAPIVEIPAANDFAQIRQAMRRMGAAVGEPARAEAWIARMDAILRGLAETAPPRPLRVVALAGGEGVPGRGTLTDAIIAAAGATNIAARRDGPNFSSFSIEQLLVARPDAILRGVGITAGPSLHDDGTRHPLIARLYRGRQIAYPDALYTCGLPQSADAAAALRRAFAALPPGRPRP